MTALISIYDAQAIDNLRRCLAIHPHCIARLRMQFFKKFTGAERSLDELPTDIRNEFAERVEFHPLHLEQRLDSTQDGATKLVFLTAAGQRLESVLLRAGTGRTALCVSSQVGCAANCDFCATGKMGFQANLSAAEILDQLVQAGEQIAAENRRIRNIVFMGMGEPFHNEQVLYDALDTLIAGAGFNHPASRILVSTVGIPEAMFRCARRYTAVNQALSLHSVRQDVRERIIPLARKYPLPELRRAISQLNAIQPSTVMIEYLMLAGVNDSLADAEELIEFLDELRVHVNLIPYNPIDAAPHLIGSERDVREAFAATLKAAGLTTTIRYSMGADIEAACGQLVNRLRLSPALPGAPEFNRRGPTLPKGG